MLIAFEGVIFAVDFVAFVLIYYKMNYNKLFLFASMQNNAVLIGPV